MPVQFWPETQMKNFKREFSAGAVVYKKFDSKIKFLLGKHSGYHKWVLAKGLIEEKEQGWQTAIRETEEETGVKARIVNKKPVNKVQYFFYADLKNKQNSSTRRVKKYKETGGKKTKVFKTVSFYLAEYVSGDLKDHGWEMEDAGWFEYEKALALMAFKGEKEALEKAQKLLQDLNKQR